jgi:hypothetical protein
VRFDSNEKATPAVRRRVAFSFLGWANVIDPEESSILHNVACVYAILGETEEALDAVRCNVYRR